MKIDISTEAVFSFTVTREILNMITPLAEGHYDGVCQATARVGGFIYGWSNRLYEDRTEAEVNLSWRNLDTLLKIMEFPPSSMDQERLRLLWDLRMSFHKAMNRYLELAERWKDSV